MEIATVSSTIIKNNFGKYLDLLTSGHEIIITKNGKEIGRIIPKDAVVSYLTDSLKGILKNNYDLNKTKSNALKEKYGSAH